MAPARTRGKASSSRSADGDFRKDFRALFAIAASRELLIAAFGAGGVKRRMGALVRAPFGRNPLDVVACVRADDGCGDLRRALAAGPRRPDATRRQRGGRLQGPAR